MAPYEGRNRPYLKVSLPIMGLNSATWESWEKKKSLFISPTPTPPAGAGQMNERHNGMIRRFIKKGQPIRQYSDALLHEVETWMNKLPQKILGYQTPNQVFARSVSWSATHFSYYVFLLLLDLLHILYFDHLVFLTSWHH